MRRKRHILSSLRGARASILIAAAAFAFAMTVELAEDAEAREDIVPGSRYVPAQAAAMGDAYLPLADEPASALIYNPAGLGLIKEGFRADVFNLQIYGDKNYFSGIDFSHPDFYKVTSLSNYLPALERNPSANSGVGASFFPSFYIHGIAFGVLMQSDISGQYMPNQTINYRSNYQLIPTAGTALKLADGIVRIGYSVQWVNQASGEITGVSPTATPLGYNQGLSKGMALSHTLGYALTLPYQYLPQLNIVGRNLFTARFTSGGIMPMAQNPTGTPPDERTSLDASLSMVEKIGGGAKFTWVAEDRDFTDTSGISLLGRMALGFEFSYQDVFFLRGGWGSGYPDAGIGFRRKKNEITFSWTSVEIGNGYHDQRDIRYVMQYQVRAF